MEGPLEGNFKDSITRKRWLGHPKALVKTSEAKVNSILATLERGDALVTRLHRVFHRRGHARPVVDLPRRLLRLDHPSMGKVEKLEHPLWRCPWNHKPSPVKDQQQEPVRPRAQADLVPHAPVAVGRVGGRQVAQRRSVPMCLEQTLLKRYFLNFIGQCELHSGHPKGPVNSSH